MRSVLTAVGANIELSCSEPSMLSGSSTSSPAVTLPLPVPLLAGVAALSAWPLGTGDGEASAMGTDNGSGDTEGFSGSAAGVGVDGMGVLARCLSDSARLNICAKREDVVVGVAADWGCGEVADCLDATRFS